MTLAKIRDPRFVTIRRGGVFEPARRQNLRPREAIGCADHASASIHLELKPAAGAGVRRRNNPPRAQRHDRPADHRPGSPTPRRTQDRWEGDDFTLPTGPELATTLLGRAAWSVELAPPPHKPFPMQTVIDADTGLIMRAGSEAFGTFHEWTDLDTDADLPAALFTLNPDIDILAELLWR